MSDDDILAPETCTMGVRGRERGFDHQTLFYSGEDAFLDGTVPYITEALRDEEPVLVAVSSQRIELLKEALSSDAPHVQFTDMRVLGSNPARIIPAWRLFLDRHGADGSSVRGIGEPVWPGRDDQELTECQRHETLLNVAFDQGQAWRLLCPYDVEALDDEVILAAEESHPSILEQGTVRGSDVYPADDSGATVFEGALSGAVTQPQELEFTCDGLGGLRRSVGRMAADALLPAARVDDLVLAVNELASNTIYHGGGVGRLRIWREGETVLCEVSDRGRITEPLVGRVQPTPDQWTGRGLWLVNQLCDLTQIRSSRDGSVVRVHMRLP